MSGEPRTSSAGVVPGTMPQDGRRSGERGRRKRGRILACLPDRGRGKARVVLGERFSGAAGIDAERGEVDSGSALRSVLRRARTPAQQVSSTELPSSGSSDTADSTFGGGGTRRETLNSFFIWNRACSETESRP